MQGSPCSRLSARSSRWPVWHVQVAAVRAVATQVAKFRRGMDDDSATQRASVRSALQVAASRSSAAISDLLQLRNLGSLSGYVLGDASANTADSPIVTVRSRCIATPPVQKEQRCSSFPLLYRADAP